MFWDSELRSIILVQMQTQFITLLLSWMQQVFTTLAFSLFNGVNYVQESRKMQTLVFLSSFSWIFKFLFPSLFSLHPNYVSSWSSTWATLSADSFWNGLCIVYCTSIVIVIVIVNEWMIYTRSLPTLASHRKDL